MNSDLDRADWVHLPASVQPTSLWDSLHDAEIQTITSDFLARTVLITVDVSHIRGHFGLPDDFMFLMCLDGIMSVRACRYAVWPGEFSAPPNASVEEHSRLVEEYQAKWREQSVSWGDLEAALQDKEVVFDVSNAELVEAPSTIALHLQGHLDYKDYYELHLRAASLSLSSNDGREFTLVEFQQFGERYWQHFAERSARRAEG